MTNELTRYRIYTFSLATVILLLILQPTAIERAAILAAISSCSKNDGVMSIKRNYFDTYSFTCRNTAKFELVKIDISATEPEDDYELRLKDGKD